MADIITLDAKINLLKDLLESLRELSVTGPEAVGDLFDRVLLSLHGEAQTAIGNAYRVLELDTLNKIGQELSSAATKGEEELLQVIFEQTSRLLVTNDLYVALYDKTNDWISFPFVMEKGEHKLLPEEDWAPRLAGRGLPEYVIRHPQPLLIDNMDGWMDEHKSDVEAIGLPAKCWLGAPIIYSDDVIGVIAVQNHDQEDFYGKDKLSVLSTIATQAGIAIKNARLFKQVKDDLNRRIKEFDALADVDKAITTENLDTVLKRVLEAVQKIVGAPTSSVMLVDDSGQYLEVRAILGESWPEGVEKRFKIGEHGVSGWVAQHKASVLISDVDVDNEVWERVYIKVLPDTRSELATPLLDETQKLLGVINLESPQVGTFTEEDQHLLEALARRAVITIENQRRYQQEERMKQELSSLSEVDKAISSTLELEQVLEMILEKGLEKTKAEMGSIMLFDKFRNDLHIAVQRGIAVEYQQARLRVGEGIVGKAAAEKRSYLVKDVTEGDWPNVYRPFIPGTRSELAVPMKVGGVDGEELIGIINAENKTPGAFDTNDQRLLENLADHAIIAIQNAKQYRRLKVLRKIDQEIISAEKIDDVLPLIMDSALELTGAKIGELRLVDPSGNMEVKVRRLTSDVTVGETWMGTQPEVVRLSEDGKTLGELSLARPIVGVFDQRDLDWLEALAGQAVVAIQNIGRLEQVQASSERLADLHQAGQELGRISDIVQLEQAYDIVIRIATAHTESHQTVIRRYDPQAQELVLARSTHPSVAPPFKQMKAREGLSGQVFQEERTILVSDVANPPPGVHVKPSDPHAKSIILAPICFEEHKYGTLGLSHTKVGHFSEADVKMIEGLAQQLAITIHRLEIAEANSLAEQRASAAEAMSAMGQSAFELAHRLGNDLGLVRTYVENSERLLKSQNANVEGLPQELGKIQYDVAKVLSLSSSLKEIFQDYRDGNKPPQNFVSIPPTVLLEEAVLSLPGIPDNIQVDRQVEPDTVLVRADHGLVADILRNLYTNAVQAMPKGGIVTLSARNVGRFVEFQVKDTGIGISKEVQKRIFDLFYSTKGSSGFGLWSARRNALANRGDLTVFSEPGDGATFTLLLPRADSMIGGTGQ